MIYSSPLVYGSATNKLVYFGLPAQIPSVLKNSPFPDFDILLNASILSLNRSVVLCSWFFFQSLINGQRKVLIICIEIGTFSRAGVCAWKEFKGS